MHIWAIQHKTTIQSIFDPKLILPILLDGRFHSECRWQFEWFDRVISCCTVGLTSHQKKDTSYCNSEGSRKKNSPKIKDVLLNRLVLIGQFSIIFKCRSNYSVANRCNCSSFLLQNFDETFKISFYSSQYSGWRLAFCYIGQRFVVAKLWAHYYKIHSSIFIQ